MKKEINASVHDIVDYVYRQGDIVSFMAQKNSMQEGTQIHRMIEKQYDCDKEVYVKYENDYNNYHILLQGRMDLLDKDDLYHVMEVKSTYTFEGLDETTYLAHFAQVKFYGFMLYHHYQLDKNEEIKLSVMYVNKHNYAKKFFTKIYTYQMLETFFYDTLNQYLQFQEVLDAYHEAKFTSITEVSFPFDSYRKGQLELINQVSNTITNNNDLFVCAPTGIGKSLATLYPAVTSIKSKENKIFYLTSKSMIKNVACHALNLIRVRSHLKLKSLVITAKEKICINDCFKCNSIDCSYAKGFYDRLNEAVMDIFTHEDEFNLDTIVSYSHKYHLCPFEFQLTLALYSDVVIGDYNYVFDVRVYLRRFFDFDTSHFILLIDEAHNMYDRVCHMFTSSINFQLMSNIINEVSDEKEILKSAQTIQAKLKQYHYHLMREQRQTAKFIDLDEAILQEVSILLNKLEKYFDKCRENEVEIDETVINTYFELNNFLKISEYYNDDFIVWVKVFENECDYQITCLNPRELIAMRTSAVKSSIFFSATLHPMDYYLSLLGGTDRSDQLILDSPFEQNHLQLFVNNRISTKYRYREITKLDIAHQIIQFISLGGKYIIYFSSYKYLEMVYDAFMKINRFETQIIKQNRHMTVKERDQFIKEFDESKKNLVGFAVLGGVFAEGIDLQGEKLNGVCIVGVGLPMFDEFRNELKNYFENTYRLGYQFAYVYPGFNKVLQAVGRVIRSENDQGMALLIDDRYLNYTYLNLFPKHWSHYQRLGN